MNRFPDIDDSPHLRERGRRRLLLVFLATWSAFALAPLSAEPPPAASELEKFASLTLHQAIASFETAPGYRIELAAVEPLVRDPIAMEFDETGAAYVIELPPYNQYAKLGAAARGSINRLTDSDGDGLFDACTVFVDDLVYPTGLLCYDGGLFVGDAPDLLYLKDEDGDGKADRRERILTGFGTELAGEGQLNSFRWGLDNRIHLSSGRDGGDVSAPDAPADARVNVRGRRVILDPRTRTFETSGGGGQYGMTFDDWGRLFACDNSDPVIQVVYDDRYLRRNPWMSAPLATRSLAPEGKFTKLTRISPVEPWRIIRTNLRASGQFSGPAEGGTPSGFFTAATGITCFRGDAWPAADRGDLLVGEAANNLIYRARLSRNSGGLAANRADRQQEFVASRDTWFRPVQFAQGPDGALYAIDMYRELIEGAAFLPDQVLAQMDPLAGSELGRIYRITHEGTQGSSLRSLAGASTEQLVQLLAHPNGWTRDTAARLLYERHDDHALEPLRKLASSHAAPRGRLHALYALQGAGELKSADLLARLSDESPRVREHAIRLAEPFVDQSKPLREALVGLADDADPEVRVQLAFSLGELPAAERRPPLLKLLQSDGDSPLMRAAIQSSLADDGAPFVSAVIQSNECAASEGVLQMLDSLANQIARRGEVDEINALAGAVEAIPPGRVQADRLVEALAAGMLRSGKPATTAASNVGDRLVKAVRKLELDAQTVALDDESGLEERLRGLSLLEGAEVDALLAAAEELLAPRQPQPLQVAALAALSRRNDPRVADAVIAQWNAFSPATRAAALALLTSRAEWSDHLLDAFERKLIAANEIDASTLTLLQRHANPRVRQAAADMAARSPSTSRDAVVAEYQQALALHGDVRAGAQAFARACAACHELNGVGESIGADLRAIGDRGSASVMLNILDPNREIKPQYVTYAIQTVDGQGMAGMIDRETSTDVFLRQADGSLQRIARADIDQMTSTGLSYMPEGLEKQLDLQAMSDLLAYLDSIQ